LQRLTGLERKKIEDEYKETIKLIETLKLILSSEEKRNQIIRDDLLQIKEKYGDERRTEIIYNVKDFSIEDMIAEENVVVTITHGGFIKRFPVSGYRKQSRGGKGVIGQSAKEDDFIEHMFIASTHDFILFFTDKGKCYSLKVHEIPEGGRASRGRSILNLINKEKDEKITAYVAVKDFEEQAFLFMATQNGVVKKVALNEFKNIRKNGIIAINLEEKDNLVEVKKTDGSNDIILGTKNGIAIRFSEKDVREVGRTAAGVKGITLEENDKVIGMVVVNLNRSTSILIVTKNGFGKRSDLSDYRITKRGGKGIITVKVSDKTGEMIAIKAVNDNDEFMIITQKGIAMRQAVSDLRVMGRNAQGVKLIKLKEGDSIADLARVISDEEDIEDEEK